MSVAASEQREDRILILAPRGRDAIVVGQVLERDRTQSLVCDDMASLRDQLAEGAGAAIVTEEALSVPGTDLLFDWLANQEPWSDFPFIVLAVKQTGRRPQHAARALGRLGNVMLLERPINAETLTSAAASALRARRRQYDARRHLRERERSQELLRESEAELRRLNSTLEARVTAALAERKVLSDIFESTDAFLQVLDHDYRFLAINKASADEFERLFGVRPRVGDNILDLLSGQPVQQNAIRAIWARALAGEEFTEVQVFGDPSRDRRHYELKFNVLRDVTGRQIGAYQFVYNVTGRVLAAQRLAEAEQRVRQSQRIEAIGQLTGGIAHDFNNLLMVISGGLSVLDRQTDPVRRQRILDGMSRATQRGAALTRQLLAFSRKQPLKAEPVDLTVRIGAMRELLAHSLRGDIQIETEFAADLWPVLIDPGELELVILNLAVNARDAMAQGGTITIRAENCPDHRAEGLSGDFVRLSVADTGVGMPTEVLSRAFEPFFTTKDIGKGSGLGLAQVYGFAHQSGGLVELQSRVNQGTVVSLLLPRSTSRPVAAWHPPPGMQIQEFSAFGSGPFGSGKVLLVEDDEAVAASVSAMLEQLGYEVQKAETARHALDALAGGSRVDVILSDVMMPGGMNGLELAREVRRRLPGVPIILASGYADAIKGPIENDEFRILRKPYELQTLRREMVGALMGRPV